MSVSINHKPVTSKNAFKAQVFGRVDLFGHVLVNSNCEKWLASVLLGVSIHGVVKKLSTARILKYNLDFRSKLHPKQDAWEDHVVHAAVEQLKIEFFKIFKELNDFERGSVFLDD